MTEAIFGLLGVLIGGLLQTSTTWWMERRREDWDARKAGRLLAPRFGRCRFILDYAAAETCTWGVVGSEIDEALEHWPEQSRVLAGTIKQDDWNVIVGAVESLHRIRDRARGGPDDEIEASQREFLGSFSEDLWQAGLTASLIGTVGIRTRPKMILRRLTWVFRSGRKLEEEAEEVLRYSYASQGVDPPPSQSERAE